MKKIIVAIDGLKYSESAVTYAIHIAKQTSSHLVGIFLEDFTYHSYKTSQIIGDDPGVRETKEMLEEEDKKTRQESVENFSEACKDGAVSYSMHHDRNIAIHELLHESVYADLLIIDSKETLTHYDEKLPTHFVRDLLSEVQCPVLLVPQTFYPINKLVLLYDGEPSSVYAIRTFSYVLPTMKQLDTEVVSVISRKEYGHLPDNRLMREFMRRHYPKAEFTVLTGVPEQEVVMHLEEQEKHMLQETHMLVVLGAYRRGFISRWMRQSMADILMEELNACLFIAHNR